jgi:hypothetical protein
VVGVASPGQHDEGHTSDSEWANVAHFVAWCMLFRCTIDLLVLIVVAAFDVVTMGRK